MTTTAGNGRKWDDEIDFSEPSSPTATPTPQPTAQHVRDVATSNPAIARSLGITPVVAPQRAPARTPVAPQVVQPTSTSATPEPVLRKGDIIAGAAAEGAGVLLGFKGRGTMTRRDVLDTIAAAGLPADWAPSAKSAHAHAGRIVGELNVLGYVVRADRTKTQQRKLAKTAEADYSMTVAQDAKLEGRHRVADALMNESRSLGGGLPTWSARWIISATSRVENVGDAAGKVVAIVTLDQNNELWIDSASSKLSERIRAEFQSRTASEEYSASDISDWMKSTLVHRFRAAKLGGNYYVKRQHADAAERLLTAFARRWGEDFLLPALPVATSEQLKAGIAKNFATEVDELLTEYREKRHAARTDQKDMGTRASESMLAKLLACVERCTAFAALVGERHVRDLRERVRVAAEEIQQTCDGIAQRFELIFDELARDADRRQGK